KPQFELPDKAVRAGDVSDPNLRRRAVESVRERAESLGFRVLATADSPVAGGSGTVEILAHLRFEGRSAKLPRRRVEKSKVEGRKVSDSDRIRNRSDHIRGRSESESETLRPSTFDFSTLFAACAP